MPFDEGPTGKSRPRVRMRLVGINAPWPGPPVYLSAFDVDANDGKGGVRVTWQPEHAMTFASFEEALCAWRQQSTICPLRPDKRPNRPLTQFTVEIEPC
jgi:hypothetical protein